MNPHEDHSTSPRQMAASLWRNRALIGQLTRREVAGRYQGSVLGVLWSLLTPLFMLAVFTFVFGTVFQSRWGSGGGEAGEAGTGTFAIVLFSGLIVFQLFSEVIARAPALVLGQVNYVKRVVFPLEILPLVALGSALFHAAVSFAVLLAFMLVVMGHIPPTALLLPVVLAPFLLLILGLTWFLASLGVFMRDISQILGTVITALMFLSPIFYPASAMPDWVRPWLVLNPVAMPVEESRTVLIFGNAPDWTAFALYSVIAAAVAFLGHAWFQKTRKGFADVV